MNSLRKHTVHIMTALLLSILMIFSFVPFSYAAGVTAQVATGPVTLNGQSINNKATRYPLLVYKDITYIPMTYHLCRFLGVKTEWNQNTSTLSISKTDERGPYSDNMYKGNISGSVYATPVTYPVIVNGKAVNNSNEKWPLINYNNITYFPLTWNYAVDSFGWQYSWTPEKGLIINSAKPAPSSSTGDKELDSAIAVLNKHYEKSHNYNGVITYKQGNTSKAFQANVSVRHSGDTSIVELTSNPFVFFENGRSVWASYKNGFAAAPSFGISGYGNKDQTEKASDDFNKTELGYISRCFLDFQFAGNRISKISDVEKVEKDFGAKGWNMNVAYESGDWKSYKACLTVNSSGQFDNVIIETENYTLSMNALN